VRFRRVPRRSSHQTPEAVVVRHSDQWMRGIRNVGIRGRRPLPQSESIWTTLPMSTYGKGFPYAPGEAGIDEFLLVAEINRSAYC
jgi:hypothetical protein